MKIKQKDPGALSRFALAVFFPVVLLFACSETPEPETVEQTQAVAMKHAKLVYYALPG